METKKQLLKFLEDTKANLEKRGFVATLEEAIEEMKELILKEEEAENQDQDIDEEYDTGADVHGDFSGATPDDNLEGR